MILIEANRLCFEIVKSYSFTLPPPLLDRPGFTPSLTLDEMNRSHLGTNNVLFREPRHTSAISNAKLYYSFVPTIEYNVN